MGNRLCSRVWHSRKGRSRLGSGSGLDWKPGDGWICWWDAAIHSQLRQQHSWHGFALSRTLWEQYSQQSRVYSSQPSKRNAPDSLGIRELFRRQRRSSDQVRHKQSSQYTDSPAFHHIHGVASCSDTSSSGNLAMETSKKDTDERWALATSSSTLQPKLRLGFFDFAFHAG